MSRSSKRKQGRGTSYQRKRESILKEDATCWICKHGGADTIDHFPERWKLIEMGEDPQDRQYLWPAHRWCNNDREEEQKGKEPQN